MVGAATLTLGMGQKEFCCPVWVANLEDCILGLDVLRALDCVINTRGGTLSFPDGQVVQMSGRPSRLNCTVNHQIAVLTTESVGDTAVCGRSTDALSVEPPAVTSDCLGTQQVLATARPIKPSNAAVPSATLLATETTAAMTDSAQRVEAVSKVWLKNCDGLTPQEQRLLWQLLLEFSVFRCRKTMLVRSSSFSTTLTRETRCL